MTFYDWLVWNQIPVTLGNAVGGFLFTGLAIYLTHNAPAARAPIATVPVPGETVLTVPAAGAF